jgi:hypothetical protein
MGRLATNLKKQLVDFLAEIEHKYAKKWLIFLCSHVVYSCRMINVSELLNHES